MTVSKSLIQRLMFPLALALSLVAMLSSALADSIKFEPIEVPIEKSERFFNFGYAPFVLGDRVIFPAGIAPSESKISAFEPTKTRLYSFGDDGVEQLLSLDIPRNRLDDTPMLFRQGGLFAYYRGFSRDRPGDKSAFLAVSNGTAAGTQIVPVRSVFPAGFERESFTAKVQGIVNRDLIISYPYSSIWDGPIAAGLVTAVDLDSGIERVLVDTDASTPAGFLRRPETNINWYDYVFNVDHSVLLEGSAGKSFIRIGRGLWDSSGKLLGVHEAADARDTSLGRIRFVKPVVTVVSQNQLQLVDGYFVSDGTPENTRVIPASVFASDCKGFFHGGVFQAADKRIPQIWATQVGNKLIYTHCTQARGQQLWSLDLETLENHQLFDSSSEHPLNVAQILWVNPSNYKIAVLADVDNSNSQVWTVDVVNNSLARLTFFVSGTLDSPQFQTPYYPKETMIVCSDVGYPERFYFQADKEFSQSKIGSFSNGQTYYQDSYDLWSSDGTPQNTYPVSDQGIACAGTANAGALYMRYRGAADFMLFNTLSPSSLMLVHDPIKSRNANLLSVKVNSAKQSLNGVGLLVYAGKYLYNFTNDFFDDSSYTSEVSRAIADTCPSDDRKVEPGLCGCEIQEISGSTFNSARYSSDDTICLTSQGAVVIPAKGLPQPSVKLDAKARTVIIKIPASLISALNNPVHIEDQAPVEITDSLISAVRTSPQFNIRHHFDFSILRSQGKQRAHVTKRISRSTASSSLRIRLTRAVPRTDKMFFSYGFELRKGSRALMSSSAIKFGEVKRLNR